MPEDLFAQLVRQRREQEAVRPDTEAVSILGRDAEQLGDHDDRKRKREVVDELHPAIGSHAVDEVVGDLLDPRSQAPDHARRERLCHQLPDATVVLAVHRQEVRVHPVVVGERARLVHGRSSSSVSASFASTTKRSLSVNTVTTSS
jgi:hypothetical protein